MKYYLTKNCKLQRGYSNTAIYNFNTKKVYLLNHKNGDILFRGAPLPQGLADKLYSEGILTAASTEKENSPFTFEYDLFDDKYSFEKCKLAYLEVTDVCNYHCIHCYANTKKTANSFMSKEEVAFYIDQIRPLGPCDIRITGGEPFLNKEIRSIIGIVRDRISPLTKHSIVSNGSFDICDALFALSKGFELQISIYGVNRGKFCSFTNASSAAYDRVIDNLNQLAKSEYRDQVLLLFSVNALTFDDIGTFTNLAQSMGFRYILNRPASVGRAVENWEKLRLPLDKLVAFSKSQRAKHPFYCHHLCQLHWISIMTNGDVTPCGFLRDKKYVFGNLKCDSFSSIWHSQTYDSFRCLNANNVEKCKECEFKYVCTAGCCGETAAYTGNILNPFSGCQIRPYSNPAYLFISDEQIYYIIKNAAGLFEFEEVEVI